MSVYYPPVEAEEAISEARRMTVGDVRRRAYERQQQETRVAGVGRETRNNGITDSEHLRNLATARNLQSRIDADAVKPYSQRSTTVNRVAATDEARFNEWLARPEHSRAYEDRAAAEGTGAAGGFVVPPRFSQNIIHALKDFDSLLSAFELWKSPHGETVVRPVFAAFGAAVSDAENASFTDGPYPTLNQQAWPLAPTYAASFTASRQLVQDAFIESQNRIGGGFDADSYMRPDAMGAKAGGWPQSAPVENNIANRSLDQWVSAALGESMGRVIAPVAQTALYGGINAVGAASGGAGGYLGLTAATAVKFATGTTTELASNTINLDTAAQMVASLDEAYLPNAAFYFSKTQWAGLLRQVDSNLHTLIDPTTGTKKLYDIPVVLTSQTLPATASTVSGPILGDISAAMTLRIADGSLTLLRSNERFAELLQVYYRASLRADVKVRDARAMVGVKYAAS